MSRLAVIVAIAAWMVTSAGAGPAASNENRPPQAAVPEIGRPLWRLDLRRQGYPAAEGKGTTASFARDTIAFGGNGEVVVLGDTHAFPKPSRVEAFAIDSAAGKVTARATWTVALRPRLFATAAGRYAIPSVDGTVLRAAGLGDELARTAAEVLMASPDGRSLLAAPPGAAPDREATTMLEADTLRPAGGAIHGRDIESISRTAVARVTRRVSGSGAVVLVEDPDHPVPPLETACEDVRVSFLTVDVLAILGCGRLEVVGLDGRRLFETSIAATSAVAAVARDGSRFAILEADWVWRDVPRLRGETLRIFDRATGAEAYRLTIPVLRGADFPASSGAALSPDGSLVAVSSLGRVSLYRLPAPVLLESPGREVGR